MSSRGRGSCPRCHVEYFNRSKPPNCGNCGHHLGGTFQGARKKTKSASPAVLEITQGVFSCRTTGRDDRCFVTSSGDMWLCTHEACKVARSVYVNSDLAPQYECDHVKLAKNTDIAGPLATYSPSILSYPCRDSVQANLNEVVSSLPPATPAVVQVSDQVFAVFGLPTASNPLGFCHVKREGRNKSGYSCTARDCRSFSSKGKGSTAKAFCLHLHLLFASLEQFSPAEQAGPSSSSSSSSSASQSEPVVSFDSEDVEDSLQRKSTILLAYKTRSLPYQFPRQFLHSIMARDSCTALVYPTTTTTPTTTTAPTTTTTETTWATKPTATTTCRITLASKQHDQCYHLVVSISSLMQRLPRVTSKS